MPRSPKPLGSFQSLPAWFGLPSRRRNPGETLDPQARFVTSYLLPPLALALVRATVATYALVALITLYVKVGTVEFSYFTMLSYWGVFGWYAHGAIQGISYHRSLVAFRAAHPHRAPDGRRSLLSGSPDSAVRGAAVSDATTTMPTVPLGRDAAGTPAHEHYDVEKYHAFSTPQEREQAMLMDRQQMQPPRRPTPSTPGNHLDAADDKATPQQSQRHQAYDAPTWGERPASWLDAKYPRVLQVLHLWLQGTFSSFPLIVTVVFWTILANGACQTCTPFNAYTNLSVHAFNLLFCYLDILFLGRAPMMPWSYLFFTLATICSYLGVAYITLATQNFITYDFLDVGKNGSGAVAAFVTGLGVATLLSFCLAQFAIFLREWTAAKLQRQPRGWGSARPAGVEDWELGATTRGPGPEGEGAHR